MNTLSLYLTTTVIWSLTWLGIKFQLGVVPETWSVAYRFGLASLLLLGYCLVTKRRLRFSLPQHLSMAAQGLFMFSLNYLLFYLGTEHLITGLVAVSFAGLAIMNIVNNRLFFNKSIQLPVAIGALVGIAGLVIVFWSEISSIGVATSDAKDMLLGLTFCVIGTLSASFGNMAAVYSQQYQIPVLQSNALSMTYGASFIALYAVLTGDPIRFDWSFSYVASLIYLVIFGSIIAFGCYLKLISQIGPGRAAYTTVLIPLLAMLVSSYFEGFVWHFNIVLGLGLVLLGNWLVLKKPAITTALNRLQRSQ